MERTWKSFWIGCVTGILIPSLIGLAGGLLFATIHHG